MTSVLPHSPSYYLRSPWETVRRGRAWLSAWLALRSCDHVGAWTRASGKISVENKGCIRIGARVQLISHYATLVLTTFPGGVLEIGDRTMMNYGVDICATKLVRIGVDCLIGTRVIILDNDFHDLAQHERMPEPRPVLIGDRVWIGTRATILPGVTIGDDAVIGAGSVVVSDVPARCLAVGNPARVIKTL